MDKDKIIWVGASLLLLAVVSFGFFNNYLAVGRSNIENQKVNDDFEKEEAEQANEEEEVEDVVSEEELSVMEKIAEIEGYIVTSEEMLDSVDRLKANPIIISDIEDNLEKIKEDFSSLDVLYPEAEVTDDDFQNEVERIHSEAQNISERVEDLF
jgi:uncharacterized protein YlxW (UPF0749 family)